MATRAKWTEREQLAALGAALDCEGCVSIGRPYPTQRAFSLRVRLAMTEDFYPQWFEEKFGGSSSELSAGRKKLYRRVRTWSVASAEAGRFLEAILPWVEVKRPQVELALRFHALHVRKGYFPTAENIAERWDCYWEMRRLNTGPHVQRLSEGAVLSYTGQQKRKSEMR